MKFYFLDNADIIRAELYVSNSHEERRLRRCIGPTGSIDLITPPTIRSPQPGRRVSLLDGIDVQSILLHVFDPDHGTC